MSEPTAPTTAREAFAALPWLLTDPYIPEVHGDLDEDDAAEELREATGIIQHLTSREYVGDPATTRSRIATAKARADRARAVLVHLGKADEPHQAVQRHDFEVGPEWTGAAA